MVFLRYFNVGSGVTQNYINVKCSSGLQNVSSYSSNEEPETNTNDKEKKEAPKNRESRRMCNLLFVQKMNVHYHLIVYSTFKNILTLVIIS